MRRRLALTTCVLLAAAGCSTGSPGSGPATSLTPGHATVPAAALPASAGPGGESRPAPPVPVRISFSFVGDTMLGTIGNLPRDPAHYLDPVRSALAANVSFANLEGTLTTATTSKCPHGNGGVCFVFRDPPSYAGYLKSAGFSIVNDANNHFHDYFSAGVTSTLSALKSAGLAQTGRPGQITVLHTRGHTVAVLGFAPYTETANLLDLSTARSMIRKARAEADLVVVYMHAGAEGSGATHVSGHEEYYVGEDRGNAKAFAHMAVDAGADLVVASGPHVVRGMEFYRGRLIAYSLGNFANFHNFSGGGILSDSAILHVTMSVDRRLVSARLLAVTLTGAGRPQLGGSTVSVIRSLSRQDFGTAAARFSSTGVISAS